MADEKKQDLNLNLDSAMREFVTRREQFENWVAKQSLPIEAAITTITNSAMGAINGFCLDVIFDAACSAFSIQQPPKGCMLDQQVLARFGGYHPLVQSIVAGTRWEQARSFAIMYGVSSGISCVMKKFRGKDDVQTRMVAAFGSGVMLSLVSGMRGLNVLSVGVLFALLSGGHFKVTEISQPKVGDVLHDKKRDKFSSIGLSIDDHHAMNFNTCFFTKNAHSLLSDRQEIDEERSEKAWLKSLSSNFIDPNE